MSIQDIVLILSIPSVVTIIGWVVMWRRQTRIEASQVRKADSEADSITLASAVNMIHELRIEIDRSNVKIDRLQTQVGDLQRERVEILQGVRLLIGQLEEKDIIPVWQPKAV